MYDPFCDPMVRTRVPLQQTPITGEWLKSIGFVDSYEDKFINRVFAVYLLKNCFTYRVQFVSVLGDDATPTWGLYYLPISASKPILVNPSREQLLMLCAVLGIELQKSRACSVDLSM